MNLVGNPMFPERPQDQELVVRVVFDQQDFHFAECHAPAYLPGKRRGYYVKAECSIRGKLNSTRAGAYLDLCDGGFPTFVSCACQGLLRAVVSGPAAVIYEEADP